MNPITKLDCDLWEQFPEWFINLNGPNATRELEEALTKINIWHTKMLMNLVKIYDFLEQERKESNGEVPIKACYVYQKKLIELILGVDIKTARTFLIGMGLTEEKANEPKNNSVS